MKTLSKAVTFLLRTRMAPIAWRSLALVLALSAPLAASAADTARTFGSPDEAVAALAAATRAADGAGVRALFGPAAAGLENPDRVQATNEMRAFTAALDQRQRIVTESDSRCVLEVGENRWPFPIPIVKRDGRWRFDTEAGKDELFNRRIGQNELFTLQTVRAYVDAQREYAAQDRDGDQVLEFAQKFRSAEGAKDGLHWELDLDGDLSPLGPLMAQAQTEGYLMKSRAPEVAPEPFHGYFFRILTRQAKTAPGGKYDYVINGNMIGGFALVAWPAEYGESGIMTFIVNQQGRVYQRDLGPKTGKQAEAMTAYDPGPGWQVSRD